MRCFGNVSFTYPLFFILLNISTLTTPSLPPITAATRLLLHPHHSCTYLPFIPSLPTPAYSLPSSPPSLHNIITSTRLLITPSLPSSPSSLHHSIHTLIWPLPSTLPFSLSFQTPPYPLLFSLFNIPIIAASPLTSGSTSLSISCLLSAFFPLSSSLHCHNLNISTSSFPPFFFPPTSFSTSMFISFLPSFFFPLPPIITASTLLFIHSRPLPPSLPPFLFPSPSLPPPHHYFFSLPLPPVFISFPSSLPLPSTIIAFTSCTQNSRLLHFQSRTNTIPSNSYSNQIPVLIIPTPSSLPRS